MSQTEPAAVSPLQAGFTCRCPRCGKGPLFTNLLSLRQACTACGLDYKFIDTGDGPAVFAIFALGFLALGGSLIMHLGYDVPLWATYLFWGVATPVVAVLLLRFLKAILIAMQFHHKAEEGRLAKD